MIRCSGGVENVQLGTQNHVTYAFAVFQHVRRYQVIFQMVQCLPFFNDHDAIRITMLSLKITGSVYGGSIFDAACFCPDVGDNLIEFSQEGFLSAWGEVNLGNYMKHGEIAG